MTAFPPFTRFVKSTFSLRFKVPPFLQLNQAPSPRFPHLLRHSAQRYLTTRRSNPVLKQKKAQRGSMDKTIDYTSWTSDRLIQRIAELERAVAGGYV